MSGFIKRTKETLPSSRSGHILLNDNNNKNVFIIGGYNEYGPLDDIYRYDCKLNKWTKLITTVKNNISPLPRLEFDCCLTSSTDVTNIYLFGGVQNIDDQVLIYNDLWCFNTNKLTWSCISEETPISERSGHVMLSISSNNFIINGGECLGRWFDDTWLYDIKQKKWFEIAINGLKPMPRSSHSIVYCEDINIIVLFGGVTSSSSSNSQQEMIQLNDLWILDMKTNNNNPKEWIWQMVTLSGIAPSPRDLPALMSLGNGKIMIMGGYGLEEVDNDNDDDDDDDEVMDSDDANEELDNVIDNENEMTSDDNVINKSDSIKLQKDYNEVDNLNITGMVISNNIIQSNELQLDNNINNNNNNNNNNDDDNDNDVEGAVEITYLDDCWILDLNTRTSIEIELDEFITNGMTVIPRRGMKISRIKDDVRDLIITFGGFDGTNFYGITETIDASKLL